MIGLIDTGQSKIGNAAAPTRYRGGTDLMTLQFKFSRPAIESKD